MNTQPNTIAHAPQPLVTATARVVIGLAAAGFVLAAWLQAGHASHEAVTSATAALGDRTIHITLPRVEVIAHRDAAEVASAAASGIAVRATNEL